MPDSRSLSLVTRGIAGAVIVVLGLVGLRSCVRDTKPVTISSDEPVASAQETRASTEPTTTPASGSEDPSEEKPGNGSENPNDQNEEKTGNGSENPNDQNPDDGSQDSGGIDYTNLAGTLDGYLGGGDEYECEFRDGYDGPSPFVGRTAEVATPGSVRNICLVGFVPNGWTSADVRFTLIDPNGVQVVDTALTIDAQHEAGLYRWVLPVSAPVGDWQAAASLVVDEEAGRVEQTNFSMQVLTPSDSPTPRADESSDPQTESATTPSGEESTPTEDGSESEGGTPPHPIEAAGTIEVRMPTIPQVQVEDYFPEDASRVRIFVRGWPANANVTFGLYGFFGSRTFIAPFDLVETVTTVSFGSRRAEVVTLDLSGLEDGFYCLVAPGLDRPCDFQGWDIFTVRDGVIAAG